MKIIFVWLMSYGWKVCFALCCLLASCAVSNQEQSMHYRGVVLDAETRLPVKNATVRAFRRVFSLTRLAADTVVEETLSRKDGSFEFVCSKRDESIDYFGADVLIPIENKKHPRVGKLGSYDGMLEKASSRHFNVILIKKHYMN